MVHEIDAIDIGPTPYISSSESHTDSAPAGGYVDFYGYHRLAGGWVFMGWVAHGGADKDELQNCVAQFLDDTIAYQPPVLFFSRDDLAGRGTGFVAFFGAPEATNQAFQHLKITFSGLFFRIAPTHDVLLLSTDELIERLGPILVHAEENSHRQRIEQLLSIPFPLTLVSGFVDFYGYHSASGGWLFCGWVGQGWSGQKRLNNFIVSFQEGDIVGEPLTILYPRQDLEGNAEGVVFFVRGPASVLGALLSISFDVDGVQIVVRSPQAGPKLRESELLASLRPIVLQAMPGLQRERFLGVLGQLPYQGQDTLNNLHSPVLFCVDEAIICGSSGLVLMGWFLSTREEVTEIYVRTAACSVKFNIDDCIKVGRADVLEAFPQHGFDDQQCGFVGFVPISVMSGEQIYIEIRTHNNEIGYHNVKRPKLEGMSAIKRLLEGLDFRFADLQRAYDLVLGPAVSALNRARLSTRPGVKISEYGIVPDKPKFSVIVPLYGRLDFVEYQLALFSKYFGYNEVELIYVLDDPARRVEAQALFAATYERTLLPFRAILLEHNVGFAPANNIGLEYAHGTYIAYLNSDVFPGTPDWLERLSDRLVEDPTLGVVGPLLLFEDGSVQHRGMYFKKLPEFSNWYFCMHQDKGLRYVGPRGIQPCVGITGACMVLRRELAIEIGGFEECYVIGDFEDSDLCFKLHNLGLRCAVDGDVELFHLERKSQLGSSVSWRMNLTLYNAWEHERRWASTIAKIQAQ